MKPKPKKTELSNKISFGAAVFTKPLRLFLYSTNFSEMEEPQRKVHLTEDYVAQTMSELYISNPKPKVARR